MKDMDSKDTISHTPSGTICVVEPSPLNWLYVLFTTMEEAVRANFASRIMPSLAESFLWVNDIATRHEVAVYGPPGSQ